MRNVFRVAVPAVLIAGAAQALALGAGHAVEPAVAAVGEPEAFVPFVERPGIVEFSGRVVVRPRQALYAVTNPRPNASAANPWKPELGQPIARDAMTDQSRARIAAQVIEHFGEVDEYTVRVPEGMDENSYAQELMATGDYDYVVPDWLTYPADTIPNDPQFGQSWQHSRLQSAAAWDLFVGSPTAIVAIVDSGIDLDHPDLVDRLVPGYNSVSDNSQANGANVDDQNGHGTFCAGCAAATGNNGTGVVGVGWNLGIMPIRATAPGTGGSAFRTNLNQGARWAAENGAVAVNVSFSGIDNPSIQSTGEYMKTRGALLFHSAGNDARDLAGFDHADVIVVGASTINDNRAGFSAFGRAVDLTAPGAGVRGTRVGGGYGNSSGTSFSSPIAAGVGAMIAAANPSLDVEEIEEILFDSCDPIGSEDTFGNGRVNTLNAVSAALEPGDIDIALPVELPEVVAPGQPLVVQAEIVVTDDTLVGVPELFFRRAGDSGFTGIEMLDLGGNLFEATLPEMACGDDPAVFIEATGVNDGTVTLPRPGSAAPFGIVIGATGIGFADNAETDLGWTVSGSASGGAWSRGVPAGDGSQSDPTSDADGSGAAFLTGNEPGDSDVDGGSTILTSPIIDFSQGGEISWSYWLDDSAGAAMNPTDGLFVETSTNGSSWNRVATYRFATTGWQDDQIDVLADDASDTFQIRFIANDSLSASLVEAGVDAIQFSAVTCGEPECPGDFDQSGAADVFDLLAFLDAWGMQDPATDFQDDGTIDVFDIIAFLDLWNAGCP